MLDEIINGLEQSCVIDDDTLVQCMLYLDRNLIGYNYEIENWFKKHGLCIYCGSQLEVKKQDIVHDELDGAPIEVCYSMYCPNCNEYEGN